jgi:hypothetical protein
MATQLPIRLPSARLADEPVDQQHQHQTDPREYRDGIQGRSPGENG